MITVVLERGGVGAGGGGARDEELESRWHGADGLFFSGGGSEEGTGANDKGGEGGMWGLG